MGTLKRKATNIWVDIDRELLDYLVVKRFSRFPTRTRYIILWPYWQPYAAWMRGKRGQAVSHVSPIKIQLTRSRAPREETNKSIVTILDRWQQWIKARPMAVSSNRKDHAAPWNHHHHRHHHQQRSRFLVLIRGSIYRLGWVDHNCRI